MFDMLLSVQQQNDEPGIDQPTGSAFWYRKSLLMMSIFIFSPIYVNFPTQAHLDVTRDTRDKDITYSFAAFVAKSKVALVLIFFERMRPLLRTFGSIREQIVWTRPGSCIIDITAEIFRRERPPANRSRRRHTSRQPNGLIDVLTPNDVLWCLSLLHPSNQP